MTVSGPDNICTSSLNTLRKSYSFSLKSRSLLSMYGFITVEPSTAICLNVDGVICSAASAPYSAGGPSSASASCLRKLDSGMHHVSITVPITGSVLNINAAMSLLPL